MEVLFQQIRFALAIDLYYLALHAALAIPDICGALSSTNGEASGPKYAQWFDQYVAPRYRGVLSGQDCYLFRCSLLHQGSTQHPKSTYSRIIFVEPGPQTRGMTLHCNVINGALNLDVAIFCLDILEAAQQWLKLAQLTPEYQTNQAKSVKRYPEGLAPYIGGLSIIS